MQPQNRLRPVAVLNVALAIVASQASGQTPAYNDVPFANVQVDSGASTTLRMDVWRSTSAERAPLVMWVHGGGWQSGSYNNPPPGLAALLSAGFAVASVEYRLSGVAIFPAQIHDVKGAARFLRAHADAYGLDPSRLAAWGSSAGGHLTALLATSGGVAELEGTTGGNLAYSSTLQAAVDYYGPTNLLTMTGDAAPPGTGTNHDGPGSAESHLIGFDAPGQGIGVLRDNLANPSPPFPEKAALVMLTNPLNFVDADDPPTFIAHGTVDTNVPIKQSERLADALAGVGVDYVMRPVVGAGHGFGTQTATVNAEAIAFLAENLMQPVGDYDRDGQVDGADFLMWQRQLGEPVVIAGAGADGDIDGTVGTGDLAVWQGNYDVGANKPSGSVSKVPEPTSRLLLGLIAGGLGWRIRLAPRTG